MSASSNKWSCVSPAKNNFDEDIWRIYITLLPQSQKIPTKCIKLATFQNVVTVYSTQIYEEGNKNENLWYDHIIYGFIYAI